jgi:hypothetical protein
MMQQGAKQGVKQGGEARKTRPRVKTCHIMANRVVPSPHA